VALQPDLGTALGYISIILAGFILTGIDRKTIIFLLISLVLLSLIVWNFGLRDYQKQRLTTVLFPESDPLGSGYQIIQSKIAIGSGGLTGKGFAKGTQSQLRFLPARHTDFIFSVIAEELGFLGAVFSVVVYFLFIARLFQAVTLSRDRMGAYIAFLVAVMISAQFFINAFMTIGLFPIAGIPLPFLSYGGSSMLANSLAVSLVMNVKMRRFVNI
jgi:rod shape determining protein RodA